MDEVILMICRYLYSYSLKTIVSKPYKCIFCANDISTSQVDNDSSRQFTLSFGKETGQLR